MVRSTGMLVVALLAVHATAAAWQQKPPPTAAAVHTASVDKTEVVEAFDESVKGYVKLREQMEDKLPDLSKESTADEIQAHENALRDLVQKARAGAKRGDIFRADISEYIVATIRSEFRGTDKKDLREKALDADTKGVPLSINVPYPDNKELTQIPPTLLLRLPQLPEQLKYRFIGRHLALVDGENALILDYIPNALP